ncbi:class I SAM-dependent methyltransferase [Kribbella sp. CA-294648]|uniref:class I SAM-dependent methyltransferase n=1 Tax=Kribbella sp. CA-294648 TaxID=3239948 RepID=UPI003D944B7C
MSASLSSRLAAVVDALPLVPGLRVLEFGCGPGAAAREVARRVGPSGFVLGVDRSPKAIQQALAAEQLSNLAFRQSAVDVFELEPGEAPYDLAFAIRVGALDGRHPAQQAPSLARIAAALTPTGRLFIDGGTPLRELKL